MKQWVKRVLAWGVQNDRVWRVLDATFLQMARFLEWERQKGLPDPLEVERQAVIAEKFAELVVKHGPFQGLKFSQNEAATGSLLAKLVGSYEIELHPIIETICSTAYQQIINIGAGEGYYAIGLALRCPQAQVWAYDTNPQAQAQCQTMAERNGVSARVHCQAEFTRDMLLQLGKADKSLILSDCEGYEKQLFDVDSVAHLRHHDVLIEVHDFVDMDISTQLKLAFEKTHRLEVIPAIGDIKRVLLCDYPELASFPKEQQKRLISEDRNHEMEWFWFNSLS